MRMVIQPHLSAGPLTLGMSKLDVELLLGAPSIEFCRGEATDGSSWQYRGRGIIATFDANGACEALELVTPADPELHGVQLLRLGAAAAMRAVRRLDPRATLDTDALISTRLGVCVYAPELEGHPDWPASSVLVFGPGYYD